MSLTIAVKDFKFQNGAVDFKKVLSIQHSDRLYGLVNKIGYKQTHKVLCVAIQLAMESINLANPLTANQIFDLSDVIIESSTEDYLALEDVILFLQKLVRGETGNLFSSIDVAKFMSMFENYRQERHSTLIKIRDEENTNYKIAGTNNISKHVKNVDRDIDPQTMGDLLNTVYSNGK